jgi:callose synthase
VLRCIMKFIVAVAWLIILPITYARSIKHPIGPVTLFGNWIGNVQMEWIYNLAVAIYMFPNILSALLFIFLPIRQASERSDSHTLRFVLWWNQVKFCKFTYIYVHSLLSE